MAERWSEDPLMLVRFQLLPLEGDIMNWPWQRKINGSSAPGCFSSYGPVAQLAECWSPKPMAGGSNPSWPVIVRLSGNGLAQKPSKFPSKDMQVRILLGACAL